MIKRDCAIKEKIINHCINDKYFKKAEIILLMEKYPDYIYTGSAYRFLSCEHNENISFNMERNNLSWTLNKECYKKTLDSYSENSVFVNIFESQVIGFNLFKFISDNFNEISSSLIRNEKEILVVKFENPNLIERTVWTSKNFKNEF